MIKYIRGLLTEKDMTSLVVEAGGIGYEILATSSVINSKVELGDEIKVYISTHVNAKDGSTEYYGFIDKQELDLYKMLIKVSGVGPKAGISLLSSLGPNDIKLAIAANDAKAIAKAPGIGKGTAEKIILELKNKISFTDTVESILDGDADSNSDVDSLNERNDAVEALVALGYSKSEVVKVVMNLSLDENADSSTIIKHALKKL